MPFAEGSSHNCLGLSFAFFKYSFFNNAICEHEKMQAGERVRVVFEGQCIVNVLHSVPVDDATLVHQSMPLKLLGVAD